MLSTNRRHDCVLLMISIACLCYALLLRADTWLHEATMPAPKPHAVLRLSAFGTDVGADAWPSKAGQAGYVEVWVLPASADDVRALVRMIGAGSSNVGKPQLAL